MRYKAETSECWDVLCMHIMTHAQTEKSAEGNLTHSEYLGQDSSQPIPFYCHNHLCRAYNELHYSFFYKAKAS